MDIKQEHVFEIKQEDIIVKDEYISDSDPGFVSVPTFYSTPTEDPSYRSKAKSIVKKRSSNKKLHECTRCGFKTSYRGWMKRHNSKCSVGQQQEYFCANCTYSTKTKRYLSSHMGLHTLKTPLSCEQCDYMTTYKSDMKRHLLVHTEKPYRCKKCNYKTISKYMLKRHLLVHRSDKPLDCKECDYKTMYESKLKRHTLVHTHQSHQCNHCDFKTLHRNSLNRHLLKHILLL